MKSDMNPTSFPRPSRARLICLPGFMGEAADFECLFRELQVVFPELVCQVYDVLSEAPELVKTEISQVGALLWDQISQYQVSADVKSEVLPTWILGYSLGGRLALAMHAARQNANTKNAKTNGTKTNSTNTNDSLGSMDRHEHFIFVSTHPGLTSNEERLLREKNDLVWAEKFRHLAWPNLMDEWNQQPVFQGGSSEPSRHGREKDRDQLAMILEKWSLAKQPVWVGGNSLWVTGGRDIKFSTLARNHDKELRGRPGSITHQEIPMAGHRVHLDTPKELAAVIASWIRHEL